MLNRTHRYCRGCLCISGLRSADGFVESFRITCFEKRARQISILFQGRMLLISCLEKRHTRVVIGHFDRFKPGQSTYRYLSRVCLLIL